MDLYSSNYNSILHSYRNFVGSKWNFVLFSDERKGRDYTQRQYGKIYMLSPNDTVKIKKNQGWNYDIFFLFFA